MKRAIIIPLAIILVILSSCGNGAGKAKNSDEKYAIVNDEIITRAEIEYFSVRSKASVMVDYAKKYDIDDFSNFWDTEYDGTTPREILESIALDDAVNAKIKLMQMREQGIYDEIGFEQLKKKAEEYNRSNKAKTPTVGINAIDSEAFYSYYIESGETKLKSILAEGILKPSEQEINDYILAHPKADKDEASMNIVNEKYEEYISSLVDESVVVRY